MSTQERSLPTFTPPSPDGDDLFARSVDQIISGKKPKVGNHRRIAEEEGVDPDLVDAIHGQEGTPEGVTSAAGAMGSMQVIPATGLRFVTPDEWKTTDGKLRAGVRYIKHLTGLFGAENADQIAAGYHAGEGAVQDAIKHGKRLPHTEDRAVSAAQGRRFFTDTDYVPGVMKRYKPSSKPSNTTPNGDALFSSSVDEILKSEPARRSPSAPFAAAEGTDEHAASRTSKPPQPLPTFSSEPWENAVAEYQNAATPEFAQQAVNQWIANKGAAVDRAYSESVAEAPARRKAEDELARRQQAAAQNARRAQHVAQTNFSKFAKDRDVSKDIAWHFGDEGLQKFHLLSEPEQQKMVTIALAAAHRDEAKKAAGVELTPSPEYQAKLRARIPALATAGRPSEFRFLQEATPQERLGIKSDLSQAPGYNPRTGNIEIVAPPRPGMGDVRAHEDRESRSNDKIRQRLYDELRTEAVLQTLGSKLSPVARNAMYDAIARGATVKEYENAAVKDGLGPEIDKVQAQLTEEQLRVRERMMQATAGGPKREESFADIIADAVGTLGPAAQVPANAIRSLFQPTKPGALGAWESVEETFKQNPMKVVPFMGAIVESAQARGTRAETERVAAGTGSELDKISLARKQALMDEGRPFAAQVASGLLNNAAFMAEFAISGGTAGPLKAAATGALTKALPRMAARKAGEFAIKAAVELPVTAARLPYFLPRTMTAYEQRVMNGEDPQTAKFYSVLDTFTEVLSESAGGATKYIPILNKFKSPKWLQQGYDKLKVAGYNGTFGEYGEERVKDVMDMVTGVRPVEEVVQGWSNPKQHLLELAQFAVPGVTVALANKVLAISDHEQSIRTIRDELDVDRQDAIDVLGTLKKWKTSRASNDVTGLPEPATEAGISEAGKSEPPPSAQPTDTRTPDEQGLAPTKPAPASMDSQIAGVGASQINAYVEGGGTDTISKIQQHFRTSYGPSVAIQSYIRSLHDTAGKADLQRSGAGSDTASDEAVSSNVEPLPVASDSRSPRDASAAATALNRPVLTIDEAAHEAATSPSNDLPQPTEAQKKAGNYPKGHDTIAGLDITFENPGPVKSKGLAGSTRSGVDPNGKPWSIKLASHYGYIKRTTGADDEQIDVFVKPETPRDYAGPVFVVNQTKGNGHFDEHKVMLGWDTEAEARGGYLANYAKGWSNFKDIVEFENPDAFKRWLEQDNTAPAEMVGSEVKPTALRVFEGDAFRVPTGTSLSGKSAADIVRFERDELGNEDVPSDLIPKLENVPASDAVWVTKSAKDAERYGSANEVEREDVGVNPVVIAEDGDGGYLVVKNAFEHGLSPNTDSVQSSNIETEVSENDQQDSTEVVDARLDMDTKTGGEGSVAEPSLKRRGLQLKSDTASPSVAKPAHQTREEFVAAQLKTLPTGADPFIATRSLKDRHKSAVENLARAHKYQELIANDEMTVQRATQILESLGKNARGFVRRERAAIQGKAFEMVGRTLNRRVGAPRNDPTQNRLEQQVRVYGGVRDDKDGAYSGELQILKESGKQGLVNETSGLSVEQMATNLAEDGYGRGIWWGTGDAKGTDFVTDVNPQAFLQAAINDASGSTKHYSDQYNPDLESPDVEAFDALLADDYGKELLEAVESGRARATDIAQLTRRAEELGLSDEALNAFLESVSETVKTELPDAISDEGYSLDADGTLLDPDGTPLFSKIPDQDPFGFADTEGLLAEGGAQPITEPRSDTEKQKQIARLQREQSRYESERNRVRFGSDVAARLDTLAARNDKAGRVAQSLLSERQMATDRPESVEYLNTLVDALDVVRRAKDDGVTLNEYLNQGSLFGEVIPDTVARLARAVESGKLEALPEVAALPLKAAITESDSFVKWFDVSKVVDKNGNPMVVYHRSASQFDAFDFARANQLGIHFGTRAQAQKIDIGRRRGKLYQAYLSLQNPLRLPDLGDWAPWRLARELQDMGIISEDEAEAALAHPLSDKAFRDLLLSHGYDGVVYENEGERSDDDAPYDDSYIALKPQQIKSATDNRGTFDPNDPSILHSIRSGANDYLDALKLVADDLALVADLKSSREEDIVWVNPEGQELLRRMESERAAGFYGLQLDRNTAAPIFRDLIAGAKDLQAAGLPSSAVENLRSNLRAALDAGGGHALIVMEGEQSETAIRHESFHVGSAKGAKETQLDSRHSADSHEKLSSMAAVAKWRKYVRRTPEYANASKALANEETAAMIAAGDYYRAGITEDEAADYLLEWAKSFYAQNGPNAFTYFRRQEVHVTKAIDEAKRLNRLAEAAAAATSGETVRRSKRQTSSTAESSVSPTRAKGLGERVELRGEGEVREASLPGTMKRHGLDGDALYYQGFTHAQANREGKELFERHGVEGSMRLLRDMPNPGPEHAVLSRIIQRVLIDRVAEARAEGRDEDAERMDRERRELGLAHASHAVHTGQFNSVAASAEVSVETALYIAEGIVREKYGAQARLEPKVAESIEAHARQAEAVYGDTASLTAQIADLRSQLRRQAKEHAKGTATRSARRTVKLQLEAEEPALVSMVIRAFQIPPDSALKMAAPSALDKSTRDALARLGALEMMRNPDGKIEDWNASILAKVGPGVEPYLTEAYADAFALRRQMLRDAKRAALVNRIVKEFPDATEDEVAQHLEEIEVQRERSKLARGQRSAKTRLLTRINDLRKMIDGEAVAGKQSMPTDADIETLKAERDRLQSALDEMREPKASTEDRRIAIAVKAVARSIAEYEERITKGEIKPEAKTTSAAWSAELGEAQKKRAELREQLVEIRKAANAPDKEKNAIAAQLKAVNKSITDLEAKIKAGNVAPKAKGTPKPTSPAIEAAKAQRAILNKLLADMRRAAKPRATPKTQAEKEAARNLPITRVIGELASSDIVAETAGKILVNNARAFSDLLDSGMSRREATAVIKDARKVLVAARRETERRQSARRIELQKGMKATEAEIDRLQTERLLAKKRGAEARAALARDLESITKGRLAKGKDTVVDVSNSSRSILAAGDLSSAILRQGGFFTFAYPERQGPALKLMMQSISELGELQAQESLENEPVFGLLLRMGVDFAKLGKNEGGLTHGEETYRGDLAKKIPGIGAIVRASDRTFAVFLDAQRLLVGRALVEDLMYLGYNFNDDPKSFRDVARLINVATGRGHFLQNKSNKLASMIMNMPYFSGRNLISRFQLLNLTLNPGAYYFLAPGARVLVAQAAVRAYSTLALVMALASLAGATVVLNWDDDEFLQVQIPLPNGTKTRFDFSFGLIPVAKHVLNLARIAWNQDRYPGEWGKQSWNEVKRFHRTKVAPGPSLVWDRLAGKNFRGQEFKWFSTPRSDKSTAENIRRAMFEGAIVERLWLLPVQDIQRAWHEGGPLAAMMSAPATNFGISASTYASNPIRATTRAEQLASDLARPDIDFPPESEEQGEIREALKTLRARSMSGEDVSTELAQMKAAGQISKGQADNVADARGLSKLQYWTKGRTLAEALLIAEQSTPEERATLQTLLYDKVQRADPGKLKGDEGARFAKLNSDIKTLLDKRKAVEPELVKLDLKFPQVQATIKVQGKDHKLSAEQLHDYQQRANELFYQRLPELLASDDYKTAEPEIQKQMIATVESQARDIVTAELRAEIVPDDRRTRLELKKAHVDDRVKVPPRLMRKKYEVQERKREMKYRPEATP